MLLIEWGSLFWAIALLVNRETYHPWFNFAVGLLGICWVTRFIRSGKFSRLTPIDLPIIIFILSALIALWASPNYQAGLVRLYLILGAVTVYYSLVNSDIKTLKIFSSVFIVFAGFTGIFLASQYDWAQSPTRFQISKDTGIWLNHLIPNLGYSLPHWSVTRNILASLLAVSLPVALPGLFSIKGKSQRSEHVPEISTRNLPSINFWVAGLSSASIIFGLILTESRAPWMIFGVIFALWIWWWLCGRIKFKLPVTQTKVFLISLGAATIFSGILVVSQPQLLSLISRIPGPKDYLGRGEIYPQSWRLAQDTPFTGGGLAAYPALYSTYIRVIPFNAFLNEDTGNNVYLNLLVEQGWLGLFSYIILLLVALRTAVMRTAKMKEWDKSIVIAGILGLGFILIQGFVHATLVASRAIPVLLIPAGLALSGSGNFHINRKINVSSIIRGARSPNQSGRFTKIVFFVMLFLISSAMIFVFRTPVLSSWYANLGAVQMAKTELYDFPSGKWDDGSQAATLSQIKPLFMQALRYNPKNRTANHRLGLIAMLNHDFPTAAIHLETAHQRDPLYRGINKALSYSYVWAGQPELAVPLLVEIPEAAGEMNVYVGWWESQGRSDLADRAKQMAMDLKSRMGD